MSHTIESIREHFQHVEILQLEALAAWLLRTTDGMEKTLQAYIGIHQEADLETFLLILKADGTELLKHRLCHGKTQWVSTESAHELVEDAQGRMTVVTLHGISMPQAPYTFQLSIYRHGLELKALLKVGRRQIADVTLLTGRIVFLDHLVPIKGDPR